ncbi:ABC transporter permease [Hoeflea prorocentri]|uniref:ABC transporter permease n=1 Tax=Hoeflea prorocentri TaxID=1922333 RepID=A0A9X3UF31_9HYPH|nr:ABC transporter permease [Hoeflea prorocentri]MCY6379369.1 ABC transporter permease [Hoeflea prorocentri]MDA5397170.1 ABC transporter permease [Hoeflea prorocentri]
MDLTFLKTTTISLLSSVPLTVSLVAISLACGLVLAIILTTARMLGPAPIVWFVKSYIFVFRGTPLLVQIFLIYYGLGQFEAVRGSVFWVVLREPFWCASLALMLNTAAYTTEIIRGGIQAVPSGQIEAARACGMSNLTLVRRILAPIALRQALPIYGSEVILMIKATSLASVITILEVTGVAHKIISASYRPVEVFMCAGAIYLSLNFLVTRAVSAFEKKLNKHLSHT